MQRLDTSDKAILESYGEDLLGHLIKEEKDILKVTMGDGTFMEVSKQSEISLNIDNYNHYTISVRDPKAATFRQVTGSTKDLANTLDLAKTYSFLLNSISSGLSTYQKFFFDDKRYRPTKGINKGKPTDLYARTKDGKIRTKGGKPRFRSSNAEWHSFKDKALKTTGKALNVLNGGFILLDIAQNGLTVKNAIDTTIFTLCIFFPGAGWLIAGSYFVLDVSGAIGWMIEQTGLSPNQQILSKETIKSIFSKKKDEKEIFPYKEYTPVKDRIPSNNDSMKKLMYEINQKEQFPRLPYRED
ncbi:hypothetical protein [Capnocytophaga cynodegmi]|uniref:hypothetical protein n=1 Tax=Capnocytophaga cynodegmi TaxID=28189 RepID=UPI003858A403